jgi:hypothetical protein
MQAGEELSPEARDAAVNLWINARDNAVWCARKMLELKVHKQVINRAIEPWMWITVIISGTEWDNFFGLRDHEAAEPHFQHLARLMKAARAESTPRKLMAGEWHLPLWDMATDMELAAPIAAETGLSLMQVACRVSIGRCARVSYLTHEGKRDLVEDLKLYDRLMVQRPLHAAPSEHGAEALCIPPDMADELEKASCGLIRNPSGSLIDRGIQPKAENSRADEWPLDDYRRLFHYWDENPVTRRERHEQLKVLALLIRRLQSGNYYGFRQYRKTLAFENIGVPQG